MIYAQPGTPGAVITFKPRYGNFIGGEFVCLLYTSDAADE